MKKNECVIPTYGWEEYFVKNGRLYRHSYSNGEYIGVVEVENLQIMSMDEFMDEFSDRDFWYCQKITKGMLKFL